LSAIGTKRTCHLALHMSAFDPKRTVLNSNFIRSRWRKPIRCPNEAVAIAKTGATLDERDALIRFM